MPPEDWKPRVWHNTWIAEDWWRGYPKEWAERAAEMSQQMKLSPEILNRIADLLSRQIPAPAKPHVRTKQSWHTLKLNTMLETKQRWFSPTLNLPAGTKLLVTKVDTEGVSLTHHSEEGILSALRWTNPEWRGMFTKVRRRKKTK